LRAPLPPVLPPLRLRGDLERAGFVFIDIQPFGWLHPSTPQPLIPLVRGIGKTLEAFWVIREFAGSLRLQATRPR